MLCIVKKPVFVQHCIVKNCIFLNSEAGVTTNCCWFDTYSSNFYYELQKNRWLRYEFKFLERERNASWSRHNTQWNFAINYTAESAYFKFAVHLQCCSYLEQLRRKGFFYMRSLVALLPNFILDQLIPSAYVTFIEDNLLNFHKNSSMSCILCLCYWIQWRLHKLAGKEGIKSALHFVSLNQFCLFEREKVTEREARVLISVQI